jgi:hypothetical protein
MSEDKLLTMLRQLPVGLVPRYRTEEPNAPIMLYDREAEISIGERASRKACKIRLVWLPSPRVEIQVADCICDLFGKDDPKVLLEGRGELCVSWTAQHLSGGERAEPPSIVGRIRRDSMDDAVALRQLLFHVANFREFRGGRIRDETGAASGRAEMCVPPWRVVLDTLPDGHGNCAGANLRRSGGYGITHVGLVEREDKAEFHAPDVRPLLESIGWMLSFVRGARTFPLLLVGRDESDTELATSWRSGPVAPMQSLLSWFDEYSAEGFTILRRLHERFADITWREPINLALHWYLICNNVRDTSLEGAIVLQQAAFEVLAWTLLVEDRRVLTKGRAKGLPAFELLRLMLSQCGIPRDIPDCLKELGSAAKRDGWRDGPHAMTKIRNALVHADPTKRACVLGAAKEAMIDAWSLGQWYLELALLWLFDYQGAYSNRLRRGGWSTEAIEPVPWTDKEKTHRGAVNSENCSAPGEKSD